MADYTSIHTGPTIDAAVTASHARSHAVTSTSDHTAGNWKVLYTDGSGDVQELALSDDGDVLTSNGAAAAPSFQESEPFNPILNGDFYFWPDGTSFSSVADATYTADCMKYRKILSTAIHDITQDTDVPTLAESGHQSTYSLKLDVTTADASVAAGEYIIVEQIIEGYNYAKLKGKLFTLSFWVKATKTGVYCVSFRNNGLDRSYVVEYTINATDTWEKKTISLTLNPTGGTDDYTNGAGLHVSWCVLAGSTYQTTKDAWQTGNFVATSSQVNACDNTANNFWLSQIAPQKITVDAELAACQRYYAKTYEINTAPGTVTAIGAILDPATRNTADLLKGESYRHEMRSAPTITIYSPVSGNSGNIDNGTSGDVAATAGSISSTGYHFVSLTSADAAQNAAYHYVANARF